MDKKIIDYSKLGGIVIGAVGLITLITRHPVQVGIIIAGAAIYFIADYLGKRQ